MSGIGVDTETGMVDLSGTNGIIMHLANNKTFYL